MVRFEELIHQTKVFFGLKPELITDGILKHHDNESGGKASKYVHSLEAYEERKKIVWTIKVYEKYMDEFDFCNTFLIYLINRNFTDKKNCIIFEIVDDNGN